MMKYIGGGIAAVVFFFIAIMVQGGTLEDVRKRGALHCGASTGIAGFSNPDESGNWTGLDVDFCKAVAAATLGDAEKTVFYPLTDKERLTALYSGDIDILTRSTSWTISNDTTLGLDFVGVSYYDGQGFMASKKSGRKSSPELNNSVVCVLSGSDGEWRVSDFFRNNKIEYRLVPTDSFDQMLESFEAGRCDVVSDKQSRLSIARSKMKEPEDGVILPEVISKEPLGPVVRQGDDGWFNIVRWTLFAMINGEDLGVDSKNVDEMLKSENPDIQKFLGVSSDKGIGLGLGKDWVYQVIKQVGNYGEVFERNLGQKSPLKIERGLNQLWNRGGIQYAPPFH